jgi:hypothetical protein
MTSRSHSGAGKTQIALQLALMAQLPLELGGLTASSCIISPLKVSPVQRLQHFQASHPVIKQVRTSLDHIHLSHLTGTNQLKHMLRRDFPLLIARKKTDFPVRLVVIDNFTMLLRGDEQVTTTVSLSDRAREISEICQALHELASEHDIAVVIINEVSDVFVASDRPDYRSSSDGADMPDGPRYRDVSPWFSTAANIPGEDTRETALGLAFANQVNVRILFTRTGRRRVLDTTQVDAKRPCPSEPAQLQTLSHEAHPILIRHMSVIFSSVTSPSSIDYIITQAGVSSCGDPTTIVRRDALFPASISIQR